ncbi:hypothetical protein L5515_009402 [Caenorhabditis briggsae]|uniref:Uncharacterized protein n=1 Tax=Caenorhabditis briggsae TaxID=6238 RepID=A0AAE9F8R3_CAEBR|nr:hypothetical protein L5515_009402 [Caenorhabditis briggsae]
MNILGILLILLGTVSNTLSDPIPPTPPEVVAELMRVLFLAADRNDTGTIVETFRLPYEHDRKTALDMIQIFRMVKYELMSARYRYDFVTIKAKMMISGRFEKIFPKFPTIWLLRKNQWSPMGWIVEKIYTKQDESQGCPPPPGICETIQIRPFNN